ncbi:gluconokinase [Yinghuangia sp. YIM S10712]|uniref:gluconokinase n=1 Tax=Yinghuangia sp. YIM S10712 TaxID=3436930 RepID=UPI003F533CB8
MTHPGIPPRTGTPATARGRAKEVVIGLDVGTTAVKAVAFGVDAPWRHLAVCEIDPGPVQDTARIAAAITKSIAQCVYACADARVLAVSVSTAMHGLIALDADMRPLTPLLTWADGRAADQARKLHTSGQAAELHRVSGTPVHPMTPLAKLLWFREHDPDLWARARWWVGLKDYALWRLTGTLVTELSSASGTGMLDMAARDWNPEALRLTGVGPDRLPRILPTTAALEISPTTAWDTGLAVGTPVVTGAADGPLGNLGTAATAPGMAGLSLGTSGAVRAVVPEPYADPEGRLFSYALTDSAWVIGGAISNGGAVVRWAGDVFASDIPAGPHRDTALLELAAAVPPGSDGLVMRPYLLPERAPLWDPDLRGAYLGLSHRHTRGHFVRAAVEAVALRLAAIVDDLERVHPVTAVRVTGGAFRSPLWRSVVAATVDRPTVFTSGAEGSALGAAALALYALGCAPTLDAAPALLDPASAEGDVVVTSAADVDTYRAMRAQAADG